MANYDRTVMGKNLKLLQKFYGYEIKELADRAHLSKSTIEKMLYEDRGSLDSYSKVADIFGVNIDFLNIPYVDDENNIKAKIKKSIDAEMIKNYKKEHSFFISIEDYDINLRRVERLYRSVEDDLYTGVPEELYRKLLEAETILEKYFNNNDEKPYLLIDYIIILLTRWETQLASYGEEYNHAGQIDMKMEMCAMIDFFSSENAIIEMAKEVDKKIIDSITKLKLYKEYGDFIEYVNAYRYISNTVIKNLSEFNSNLMMGTKLLIEAYKSNNRYAKVFLIYRNY